MFFGNGGFPGFPGGFPGGGDDGKKDNKISQGFKSPKFK
jgi:hypothetical protein